MTAGIDLKWGELALQSIALELKEMSEAVDVSVKVAGKPIEARHEQQGTRLTIRFAEFRIAAGQDFAIVVTL